MITRLEDKVRTSQSAVTPIIQFDKNEQLKGQQWLDPIYKAIQRKQVLAVRYQSFKSSVSHDLTYVPYLLKEYNNRWFLLGAAIEKKVHHLIALDRIQDMRIDHFTAFREPEYDPFRYFDEVIGVSKTPRQRAIKVILRVQNSQLPYITTKPIHPSQTVLEEGPDTALIRLTVIWNYELEREIISMGDAVEVLKPGGLRRKVKVWIRKMMDVYEVGEA